MHEHKSRKPSFETSYMLRFFSPEVEILYESSDEHTILFEVCGVEKYIPLKTRFSVQISFWIGFQLHVSRNYLRIKHFPSLPLLVC